MKLTDRQKQVYTQLIKGVEKHGSLPTMRQIADNIGAGSANAILGHLRALEKKGWVKHVGSGVSGSWVPLHGKFKWIKGE